ncbi:MAG: Ig-like domain-containing protein, partial [Muribaculaceae bacterium]|nr:Ig-like domain-containing protein [Muribaculaceae bacterium]
MTTIKQTTLILLLAVLCAAMGWAQPYRINRQRMCIEGANFVKKASVSSQNYLFMDDFSIAPGETKTVPVYLTSSMPIWMFQADVVLPAGLTATNLVFSPAFYTTTVASEYSVDSDIVDGNFRILAINTTKTQSIPARTRQHLFDLTIYADASLTPATLIADICGFDFIEASTGNEYAYEGDSKSCTVTITQPLATGMSLSRNELSMYVGDQSTLTATVTPRNASQNVSWGSTNISVASVNQSGVVTAVGEGTAAITATTTDGSYITRTCAVTVSPILVTSVTLNTTSTSIQVGGTTTLTATVLPSNATNKALTWSSSNTAVATVNSNGVVTAKTIGTATVTASAQDGSGKSASCIVTVTPILATGITLAPTTATLEVNQTVALTATVLPSDATCKTVAWQSSNTAVATVDDNGIVTAVGDGTAVITATTADGSNLSATCLVTVTRPQATAVVMSDEELTIKVGQHTALTATVLPTAALQRVAWSSSKPTVATVDGDGNITALAAGITVVTATTIDGSNLTATCIVTVKEGDVRGDINGDGKVDIDDVNLVLNLIVRTLPSDTYSGLSDLSGDGKVDIDDLNIIINIILGMDSHIEFSVNGVKFTMIKVAGGTFSMGATAEQTGASANEKPAHEVTVSSFAIGETPVTQALWQAVMGSNPSYNQAGSAYPVEQVSWNDCQTFSN